MVSSMMKNPSFLLTGLLTLIFSTSGCDRVSNIGQVPEMSPSRDSAEFEAMRNASYAQMHLPARSSSSASLWASSSTSVAGDRRATQQGDILTVVIQIDDRAEIQNSSGRTRSSADKVGIPALAGIPQRVDSSLPEGASMDELVDAKSSSTFKGSGNITRRDKLTLRVAATVIDRLPNGVLHIEGSQEVRVNYEVRVLTVSGFVRPSDIQRQNEVAYDRIAGARISYGGRGQISDVQQPRYGQQISDIILPY